MADSVLFVDDDRNVLSSYARQFRRAFEVKTALSGEGALLEIETRGPFAVVVADMQMPGMNGVELLRRVKEVAPDTVRIMLTGSIDQKTAVDAVNEGSVFRFVNKPCPAGMLRRTVEDAIRQYQLVTAERQLLEGTLNSTIEVLTEILSMVDPHAFELTMKLRESVELLVDAHRVDNAWELKAAAMLSQIGCVTLPPAMLARARRGESLSEDEESVCRRVPEIGARLLGTIPRFEMVARIVLYQEKRFDGSGFPDDGVAAAQIPWGSRVLKIFSDLIRLERDGRSPAEISDTLCRRTGWYDPELLDVATALRHHAPARQREVEAEEVKTLRVGQTLASHVETLDGKRVISSGHKLSGALLERIRNFHRTMGIREPIHVEVEGRGAREPTAPSLAN